MKEIDMWLIVYGATMSMLLSVSDIVRIEQYEDSKGDMHCKITSQNTEQIDMYLRDHAATCGEYLQKNIVTFKGTVFEGPKPAVAVKK
jgi:hypothetical protein